MFWWLSAGLLLVAALATLWPLLAGTGAWRGAAVMLSLLLPTAALLLYVDVGNPEALDPGAREPAAITAQDMDDLTERLRSRLTESPEDLEGWVLLARTYKTLQRYDDALSALETARRLQPDHPVVMVEWVEARLFASGNPRITANMVMQMEQAVGAQPGLQKGYWLLGLAAAQRGDDQAAINWWEMLVGQVEPDSGVAQAVQAQIAEARSRLGEETATGADPIDAPEYAIEVSVSDTARSALASPDEAASLFIIVRAAGAAGGPPLGVRRIDTPELPLSIELSDADSMLPQRPISSVQNLEAQARWSRTGNPMAAPGDWQSATVPMTPGEPVQLVLDQPVE
ncbi:tetratricopeptide repeat protein [Elongatibacter sediminis]|uniref:Cytochrome C biogenesis protein n=1 Tax=Elongatibacter sediminis TaxID=3119006 RepID=A0AAW9RFJ4_9GAMM